MTSPVSYELVDDIGVITVDNPPVNALSHAVRQGLHDAILAAQKDASRAVLIVCAGRTFIAGADITEFGKPPREPHLPDLCNTIEASSKIVVAALHGTALGGGLEVALSCHYRCEGRFAGGQARAASRRRRDAAPAAPDRRTGSAGSHDQWQSHWRGPGRESRPDRPCRRRRTRGCSDQLVPGTRG